MNSRITEEFVLLVSILKWFVLATGVGILVGEGGGFSRRSH